MLELHAVSTGVVGCFGRPATLDQLTEGAATPTRWAAELSVRVAPDELLLLTDARHVSEIEDKLQSLDGGSLVFDLSSGYATWALAGDDRLEAFCRLSAIKLPDPPATAQGLVAHVPAKVIVRPEELLLMVSSGYSHHIRERVLGACADLSPTEGAAVRLDAAVLEEGAPL